MEIFAVSDRMKINLCKILFLSVYVTANRKFIAYKIILEWEYTFGRLNFDK